MAISRVCFDLPAGIEPAISITPEFLSRVIRKVSRDPFFPVLPLFLMITVAGGSISMRHRAANA